MYGVVWAQEQFLWVYNDKTMRKESTIVVYDYGLAIAEEIAAKLGAETISAESLSERTVENSRNLILSVTVQDDGQLTPLWQYGRQTLQYANLSGKTVALYVRSTEGRLQGKNGRREKANEAIDDFCERLKRNGAHVVGQTPCMGACGWNTDDWIASVSPNLL